MLALSGLILAFSKVKGDYLPRDLCVNFLLTQLGNIVPCEKLWWFGCDVDF